MYRARIITGIMVLVASDRISKMEKDAVKQFFRLIHSKRFSDFETIFEHDAVVSEPFSQAKHLRGQFEINAFLKIALSANMAMQSKIKVEKLEKSQDHKISALVSFDQIDKTKSLFIFELNPESKKDKEARNPDSTPRT